MTHMGHNGVKHTWHGHSVACWLYVCHSYFTSRYAALLGTGSHFTWRPFLRNSIYSYGTSHSKKTTPRCLCNRKKKYYNEKGFNHRWLDSIHPFIFWLLHLQRAPAAIIWIGIFGIYTQFHSNSNMHNMCTHTKYHRHFTYLQMYFALVSLKVGVCKNSRAPTPYCVQYPSGTGRVRTSHIFFKCKNVNKYGLIL